MRVVYKNLVVHPDTAMTAHLAACGAGRQGKFLEFTKMFWEKGFGQYSKTRDASHLGEANIMKMAAALKLNTAKLKADITGEFCKNQIATDEAHMRTFRVSGTPSFFINGKFAMFSGRGGFKALIDAELKAVEASGVPAAEYYQKVVMEQGEKAFKSRVATPKDS